MTGDCCAFEFHRPSAEGKDLMRFGRLKPPFSNFCGVIWKKLKNSDLAYLKEILSVL